MRFLTSVAFITNIGELRDAFSILQFVVGLSIIWDRVFGRDNRYGETITTSFAESTVNEVVAKRMVKKQQMQWSPIGAHYLLQTRTSVFNGELRGHFEQRYPALRTAANDSESTMPEQMAA